MAQHGLVNIKKCDKTSYNEVLGNIEALMGATSSDEHGAYIKQKIETILDNKRVLAEESTRLNPNAGRIARYNANIANCIDSIGVHLKCLGATKELIAEVTDYLKDEDYQMVTLKVLELMAKKNPGLNQRKYTKALQMVAEKAKQTQH